MWFFFFKRKTAYEMRISDGSSDVCSSDLRCGAPLLPAAGGGEDEDADEPPPVRLDAAQRLGASRHLRDAEGRDAAAAERGLQVHLRSRAQRSRRSEERTVGKECVSTCRARGSL